MSDVKHGTSIEWTHGSGYKGETWNPVTGCSKVSPGCAHCYAEALTERFAGRKGYIVEHRPWTPENAAHNVTLWPERLNVPLHWRRPRMVFVNSMSDLFHEEIPDEFIECVFATMGLAPRHVFQVLTKRPERALEFLRDRRWRQFGHSPAMGGSPCFQIIRGEHREGDIPLPNVWLGVSIENSRFTWRADVLREIPAAVRFISAEPLLGSLYPKGGIADASDPRPHRPAREAAFHAVPSTEGVGRAPLDLTGIDWLIVGGESGGRQARPMHPEWARELLDACIRQRMRGAFEHHRELGHTAFFFKQWGSWAYGSSFGKKPEIFVAADGFTSENIWDDPGLAEWEHKRGRVWLHVRRLELENRRLRAENRRFQRALLMQSLRNRP